MKLFLFFVILAETIVSTNEYDNYMKIIIIAVLIFKKNSTGEKHINTIWLIHKKKKNKKIINLK